MNMKYLLGVLLILACLVPLASAADVVVRSDVSPSFSMTVAPGTVNFPLTVVGENNKADGNLVSVTSNGGYTIKMKDGGTGTPVCGRMREFDGSSTFLSRSLTNPMQVSLNGAYTALTCSDQTIHTSAVGESFSSNLRLRQTTVITDAPLPSPEYYQLLITITGAANP